MVDDNGLSKLLTTSEVARLLHVHINTVRRWSDEGLLKNYRIGKRGDRRFKKEDIAHFLSEMTEMYNISAKTPDIVDVLMQTDA